MKYITLFGCQYAVQERPNGDLWLTQVVGYNQVNANSLTTLTKLVQKMQIGKQLNFRSVLVKKESLEWVILHAN